MELCEGYSNNIFSAELGKGGAIPITKKASYTLVPTDSESMLLSGLGCGVFQGVIALAGIVLKKSSLENFKGVVGCFLKVLTSIIDFCNKDSEGLFLDPS